MDEMRRIASQALRVSQIQHDNIVTVRDFVSIDEARVMVLEWVDGLDLARLFDLARLEKLRQAVPKPLWDHLTTSSSRPGEDFGRVKPGLR